MDKLGKYELLGELGRGAFGVVYRARDPRINRLVALKTLNQTVGNNPSLLERFYREAQSAGSLQHPNIVTIYDMGEDRGTPFIAMELVDGSNFERFIANRTELPVALKLAYAVQACRAFDYAHKRGIVHRDIKPANVMLNKEGVIKVVDFGIARVLETSKTQTGTLIGTFSYMPPELFRGEHATERSDIWSFGVLLYELLAYKTPFGGDSPASLMQNICLREPPPLSQLVPDCPPDLTAIVHRTLQKSQGERFQTMEDLLLELDPICRRLQEQSVSAIVDRVQGRMEEHDIEASRELLRQALQVDPNNLQARSLMEKLNAEARRLSVRAQAEALVGKGRSLLAESKLQEANAEIDNALRLDSQFRPALEVRGLIQTERKRQQEVSDLLQSIKQRLVEGLPDEAEALLLKVQEIAPSNPELPALGQQVQEEKERRRSRSQLTEGMQQARLLWTQQRYQECVDVLTGLQQQFPDEHEVASQLETAREDQAEQKKHDTLAEARSLLASRRYEECIQTLALLSQQFPHEEEIERLLQSAQEDQTEQAKQEGLTDARKLIGERRYEESATLLANLQTTFPRDEEIARLLTTAREGHSEQGKQKRLAEARDLLSARHYLECIGMLMQLHLEFPANVEIGNLLQAAQQEQAEQTKQKILMRARKLLSLRRYPECLELIDKAQRQFPGDHEVERFIQSVRNDEADHAKQQSLAEARKLVAARRYEECVSLLEAFQHQFPGDEEVEKLLASTRKEQAEQHKQEQLELVRTLLAAREYQRCFAALSELQKEFPDECEIGRLLETAQEVQTQQDKREKVAQARKLLSARNYDECLASLAELQKEFPQEEEISRLLETARHDQAEHNRKLKLTEARKLLAAQEFATALEVLGPLLSQNQQDSAVLKLRALIEREQEKRATSEVLRREWEALKKLTTEKAYAEVLRRSEELLKQFPDQADLKRLAEFARREQSQLDTHQRLQNVLDQVRGLLKATRFPEAADAARAGLASFPENIDLRSLLEQSETGGKKESVRQLIEARVREIKTKINRGELSEAKSLARQTLTMLGPDTDVNQLLASAEVEHAARETKSNQERRLGKVRTLLRLGRLDAAAGALDELIKSGDFDALDPRLYEVAEEIEAARTAANATTCTIVADEAVAPAREYAMIEGPAPPVEPPPTPRFQAVPPAAQPSTPPARPAPPPVPPAPSVVQPTSPTFAGFREWGEDTLRRVERQLAAFIGPMAKIMVKKAAAKAGTVTELYEILAASLKSESERREFLAKNTEKPWRAESSILSGEPSQSISLGGTQYISPEITPAAVEQAARLLGHYLGPISRVHAKQAAKRADGLRSFYLLLAEHLQNPTERARFLHDAGISG